MKQEPMISVFEIEVDMLIFRGLHHIIVLSISCLLDNSKSRIYLGVK